MGTALAWQEALWDWRLWDRDRDTPRIQTAFKTIRKHFRSWPVPADFFANFPRQEERILKLPKPQNDEVRKREMQKISEIFKTFQWW